MGVPHKRTPPLTKAAFRSITGQENRQSRNTGAARLGQVFTPPRILELHFFRGRCRSQLNAGNGHG